MQQLFRIVVLLTDYSLSLRDSVEKNVGRKTICVGPQ
jgi:hypothetical protein